jgi:rRNA-processing protein FCF1
MKQILLDTNFILSCIKQKIDFFDYLEGEGYDIIIPEQVINELEKLKEELALRLLKKNKFEEIYLKGKIVDNSIINYAKENPDTIIATLDREIQNKIRNKKMIIVDRRKLEII